MACELDFDHYRRGGFKLTPQRVAILEYLHRNTDHPSAEEIYRVVRERFPTMSFATVYNTLDCLRDRGEIRELTIDPSRRRYDPDPTRHHHLICTTCGKIVDVHGVFDVTIPPGEDRGYSVQDNHIEFYGVCTGCESIPGADGADAPRGGCNHG